MGSCSRVSSAYFLQRTADGAPSPEIFGHIRHLTGRGHAQGFSCCRLASQDYREDLVSPPRQLCQHLRPRPGGADMPAQSLRLWQSAGGWETKQQLVLSGDCLGPSTGTPSERSLLRTLARVGTLVHGPGKCCLLASGDSNSDITHKGSQRTQHEGVRSRPRQQENKTLGEKSANKKKTTHRETTEETERRTHENDKWERSRPVNFKTQKRRRETGRTGDNHTHLCLYLFSYTHETEKTRFDNNRMCIYC